MAEIKWIKVVTDMFDSDTKIKQIELMPKGDTIVVIWFKLMMLAGKTNAGGAIYITPDVPFTDKALAGELRRPLPVVQKALSIFEEFGMIEREKGFIHLLAWEKHQNTDKLAEIREYNKLKQRESREKRKLAQAANDNENVNDKSMTSQTCQDSEEEKEREKEKELHSFTLSRARENDVVDNSVDGEDSGDARAQMREYMGGELGEGLILMSDEQFAYLLERYSLDEIHYYFGVIKDQIRKGRTYTKKTHFQAFIDMAEKDRKKK